MQKKMRVLKETITGSDNADRNKYLTGNTGSAKAEIHCMQDTATESRLVYALNTLMY